MIQRQLQGATVVTVCSNNAGKKTEMCNRNSTIKW